MNPWAVNWTDYDGKVHPEPIDINCRCFDPTKTIVLNPAAWANVPDGHVGQPEPAQSGIIGASAIQAENFNLSRTFPDGQGRPVRIERPAASSRTSSNRTSFAQTR